MDRRVFLKLSGLAAIGTALGAQPIANVRDAVAASPEQAPGLVPARTPAAVRLAVPEPGTYQLSGQVRLLEPRVEIHGIAHPQTISWSDRAAPERPLADFTAFAHFDRPGMTPPILVQGGRLESLTLRPVEFW